MTDKKPIKKAMKKPIAKKDLKKAPRKNKTDTRKNKRTSVHDFDFCEPPLDDSNTYEKMGSVVARRTVNRTNILEEDDYKLDPHGPMSRRMNQITPMEKQFCDAYVDNIGIIAARTPEEYAEKVAEKIGIAIHGARQWASVTLQEPCVQRTINKRKRAQARAACITKENILAEYSKIAFSDIGDIATVENGSLRFKNFDEISDDARATIAEITEVSGEKSTSIKLKTHNKMEALKVLMTHMGLMEPEKKDEHGSPQQLAMMALQTMQMMSENTGGALPSPETAHTADDKNPS